MFQPGVDLFPPDPEFLPTSPATRVRIGPDEITFDDPPGYEHPGGYGQPVERMTPPDPANVRLDPRLMTHQRLLDLVGGKMIRFAFVGTPDDRATATMRPSLDVYIDCCECGQGITAARPTSPVQLAADVLRHYTGVHGLSLAGGGDDGT